MNTFFHQTLLNWYTSHGRHDLPWQQQSAYHVWLSEIMLQQTQVNTVLPYYHRFIEIFPTIETLALADEDLILKMWAGLGYYHRAKNLHQTAKIIHTRYANEFPQDLQELKKLPGIGASTAAAITSQAFQKPDAILDGNVKRVLARFFGIDEPINQPAVVKQLQKLADACMPLTHCQQYTQAIMDMGATCCKSKSPNCSICPLQKNCQAFLQQKTSCIPVKIKAKPRKKVPYHFEARINNQKQIYLVKRPETGIWPKLWCLPLIEPHPKPIGDKQYQHELTHQRMDIHVHWQTTTDADATEAGWFDKQSCQSLGLPKPIQVIIDDIFTQRSD